MSEARRDTIPERDFVEHEHRELARDLDRINEAGMLVGTNEALSLAALDILHWVEAVLEPHAKWEDRWLYPEIDRRAATAWATKLMSFEHVQIRDAVHALAKARARFHEAPTSVGGIALRARLFALEAILRAHVAREERFLIPLLDAGTPSGVGVASPL